jgi:hypothetical protein
MPRRMMVSALAIVGLIAVSGLGQPPNPGQPKTNQSAPPPDARGKKADPADGAVKAALANDSDVQVARAKVLLAEAELAKAKQAVVLKVMSLRAAIQESENALAGVQERYSWAERMVAKGLMEHRQLVDERHKLEAAKIALSRARTELNLLTGGGKEMGVEIRPGSDDVAIQRGLLLLSRQPLLDPSQRADSSSSTAMALAALFAGAVKAPVGAVPERIRAALDKPVKIGAKGQEVHFDKALEVFKKDAGLDVTVRYGANTGSIGSIISEGEDLPVGAWFQLYQDAGGVGVLYVREYGLLFCNKHTAPPDAPTLTEFWKQKPPAKAPPDVNDPEKKPGK